jgi:preprotein translocase subunit SecF
MEFFHKVTRFPFMRTRKVWYGLSALLIVGSLALVVVRGLNLGIDFTGGVNIETNFTQSPNIDQLRGALAKAGVEAAQVQAFGSSRDILVRLPPDPNVKGEQIGAKILDVFKSVDPEVKLLSTEVVGPQVGQELFVHGAWALVIGYSLNDTVIVFDRVRERARNARKLAVAQVIDESINQTLSRTLMTKLVTLLVVVFLLIFGGETLHGFSAALVIGIIAGTYSSIYISAALALDLGLRTDDLLERKLTRPEEVDGLP